jgi:hypothetical protein
LKLKPDHREITGHEIVEVRSAEAYRPYDRLILRDSKGRTIWTVLACELAEQGWTVTGDTLPAKLSTPSPASVRGEPRAFEYPFLPSFSPSVGFGGIPTGSRWLSPGSWVFDPQKRRLSTHR